MNKDHRYDDLLSLEYHPSTKHPPMSRLSRAAQFSPFAALTGYDDAVAETARYTEGKIELTDSERLLLDQRLHDLSFSPDRKPSVTLTCFLPDNKKSGGSYKRLAGRLIKIDTFLRTLRLELTEDHSLLDLPMDQIISLEEGSVL